LPEAHPPVRTGDPPEGLLLLHCLGDSLVEVVGAREARV